MLRRAHSSASLASPSSPLPVSPRPSKADPLQKHTRSASTPAVHVTGPSSSASRSSKRQVLVILRPHMQSEADQRGVPVFQFDTTETASSVASYDTIPALILGPGGHIEGFIRIPRTEGPGRQVWQSTHRTQSQKTCAPSVIPPRLHTQALPPPPTLPPPSPPIRRVSSTPAVKARVPAHLVPSPTQPQGVRKGGTPVKPSAKPTLGITRKSIPKVLPNDAPLPPASQGSKDSPSILQEWQKAFGIYTSTDTHAPSEASSSPGEDSFDDAQQTLYRVTSPSLFRPASHDSTRSGFSASDSNDTAKDAQRSPLKNGPSSSREHRLRVPQWLRPMPRSAMDAWYSLSHASERDARSIRGRIPTHSAQQEHVPDVPEDIGLPAMPRTPGPGTKAPSTPSAKGFHVSSWRPMRMLRRKGSTVSFSIVSDEGANLLRPASPTKM
ncbi:hypothetical protein ACI68E_003251 [Malassezia pachydermatis]